MGTTVGNDAIQLSLEGIDAVQRPREAARRPGLVEMEGWRAGDMVGGGGVDVATVAR